MTGVCRYCRCTEAHACPQGCVWQDETQELCSVCAAAMYRAIVVLAALTEIYPASLSALVLGLIETGGRRVVLA